MSRSRHCYAKLAEQGYSLVALLIAVNLHLILFACTVTAADLSIRQNTMILNKIALQEEVRYAMDSIVRDFMYAKDFVVTDNRLEIITDKYGQKNKKIIYTIDTNQTTCRLTCDNQPITGESKRSNSIITQFQVEKVSPTTISIRIEAAGKKTKNTFALRTVITAFNMNQNESLQVVK